MAQPYASRHQPYLPLPFFPPNFLSGIFSTGTALNGGARESGTRIVMGKRGRGARKNEGRMTRERKREREGDWSGKETRRRRRRKVGQWKRVQGRLGSNSRPREDYLYLGKPLEGGCTPTVELRSCCVATRSSYRASPGLSCLANGESPPRP